MLNFRFRIKEGDLDELGNLMESSRRVWNYALMLQRKSYEWAGKLIPFDKIVAHLAKIRNRNSHWQKLNSQCVQEICERIEVSYNRFFKKLQMRPPQFKSRNDDCSFLFKQCGYKIENDRITINNPKDRKNPIGIYRFEKHRYYPIDNVKTVRIKRYNNRYYVIICCDCKPNQLKRTCHGSIGIDFGLKTFITLSDGTVIESPRWMLKARRKLCALDKALSRTTKGSKNRAKAKMLRANLHAKIAQRREDWHWKLAHSLCRKYSVIKIEDLCLLGMKKLWGYKISDLAIGDFVRKLEHVASKYGTQIIKVDRFFASSHICHKCQKHVGRRLGLLEREWLCPHCGVIHDRDVNAAINIKCWEPACASAILAVGRKQRSKTKVAIPWRRRDTNNSILEDRNVKQ